MLLYELLTGTTPFDQERLQAGGLRRDAPDHPRGGAAAAEHAAEHAGRDAARRSRPAARPTRRRLSRLVRGELDWIVMKALEKDRNRRYETANGFAADVQRYLTDEPVRGVPAVGVVPVPQVRPAEQAGGADGGRWSPLAVVLAAAGLVVGTLLSRRARPGPATDGGLGREAKHRRERAALLPAHRPGGAGMVGEQPEPDGTAARATARRTCAAGNGTTSSGCGTAPFPRCATRAPSTASRSAPTASYLATATQAGVVRLWQAKTGQELRKWQAHEEQRHQRRVQPRRPVPRLGRLGRDGQGLGRAEGPSGRGPRAPPSAGTHQPGPGVECRLQPGRSAPGLRQAVGRPMRKGK